MEKKKRNVVYDDLDHLAGTWDSEDIAEFEHVTVVFEMVDEDMWKYRCEGAHLSDSFRGSHGQRQV